MRTITKEKQKEYSQRYYKKNKERFWKFRRTPKTKAYMRNYMKNYLNSHPEIRAKMREQVKLHNRLPEVRRRIKAYEKKHDFEIKKYRREYMVNYRKKHKEVKNGKRKRNRRTRTKRKAWDI